MIKKIKNSGFTLIELLVVIAIIGVLASIVLVSLGGARAKASASKAKSDLSQVMTAFELFQSDNVNTNGIAVDNVAATAGTEACGTAAGDRAAQITGAGTTYTTSVSVFSNNTALSDLCSGNVFSSDSTNAPVKDTVYMQTLPAPPATYFYELASASSNSYSIIAKGFSDTGSFTCTNGSCSCSTANLCQK